MEDKDTMCVGKDGQRYKLESMYKQVRELLGEDSNMKEQELKVFMRSEMFLQVCPDLYEAFNSMERRIQEEKQVRDGGSSSSEVVVVKQEKDDSKQEDKIKTDCIENLKENDIKLKSKNYSSNHADSSKDEEEEKEYHRRSKKKKHHKKKQRTVSSSNSSSSDSDTSAPRASTSTKHAHHHRHHQHKKKDIKPEISDIKIKQEEKKKPKDVGDAEKSSQKVHPYYLGQSGPVVPQKGKLFGSNNHSNDEGDKELFKRKKKIDEHQKKKTYHQQEAASSSSSNFRQPKPCSFYNRSAAKVGSGKNWKPYEDAEFSKYEKKFKLRDLSVLCVDLANLHNVVPLKRHLTITTRKEEEIESQEKIKRKSFKHVLKRLYSKNRKRDNKYKKRAKYEADSGDSSDPVVPNNRARQGYNNKVTEKSHNTKVGSAAWKKDQRQKSLEQLREKNEQKNRTTRKLPWENDEYFGKSRNSGPDASKNKGSANNQKDRPKPEVILPKIPKRNAPATSVQNLLNQIESARLMVEQKPKVELKIPKFSETPYSYSTRQQKTVTQGLVAHEVDKLLRSNTTVQCPAMTNLQSELAEYTIRKIGWWLLKEEEDPPDEVIYHPEYYDNKIYEDWFNPEDHQDDDDCSIGCVSDPEGTETEIPQAPTFFDADKLDEYAASFLFD